MDVVGSDYVYLSDECSQDVLSLWSDAWSVDDPVTMPELNYDDEFNDVFPAELVQPIQSCDDNVDWLSDLVDSACPNTVAGYVPLQIVSPSSGPDERLLCSEDCKFNGLSPADSGHHSIASSLTTTQYIVDNADDFIDSRGEHTPELNSQRENSSDIHVAVDLRAESRDMSVNCRPEEADGESIVAETEFVSEITSHRSQRVAARRAEIALLAREESDCDADDDDDVDEVADADFQSRCQLQAAEITSSRRGRSRAVEVNRNALNARINRQKKKAYMASLESQKARLLDDNKRMKSLLSSLVYERDNLVDEVKYLKSVLANDSALAQLVQSINGPPLKLSSQFDWAARKRRDVESDHNYGPVGPRSKVRASVSAVKTGGICLHVRENQLSMELCHRCSHMAGSGDGSCSDS